MEKANGLIRKELRLSNVRQWALADALGIDETVLCKRLRHELPEDQKAEILKKIWEIAGKRGKG